LFLHFRKPARSFINLMPIVKTIARIAACLIAVTFLVPGLLVAQGSLTPPGPPGPSMKTLDQVEPRIPISIAPFVITEAGSYYLTANLSASRHGIEVRASGVTIDLSGFTITGSGGGTDYGIQIGAESRIQSVAIRNGKLVNFGVAVVIVGEGANGVLAENLQIVGGRSIWVASNCTGAVFRNNMLLPGETGINVTAFSGRSINGITIANNRIVGGTHSGITLHAQDGAMRGVSVLNNQIADTQGASISVSIAGAGTHGRILIDSNHTTRGEAGFGVIVPENAGATVVRNFFMGGHIALSTNGNTIGPVIYTVGAIGTTGAAMSPWANFHHN
jgi:hypothetical protein